ncbi:unnamed protein product [Prorocentrum cordatum]|uniref:Uncharacterized protein n=1 Tax=Prorocentrum cordatum TaxID=2364126 RepID=A0ABN9UTN7_9DINO|nr:unnamed protein product [Polarella glacialis]
MLLSFQPLLRPGGRMIGVSSMAGMLGKKYSAALQDRLTSPSLTLEQLDAIAEEFVAASADGRQAEAGFLGGGAYATSKTLMSAAQGGCQGRPLAAGAGGGCLPRPLPNVHGHGPRHPDEQRAVARLLLRGPLRRGRRGHAGVALLRRGNGSEEAVPRQVCEGPQGRQLLGPAAPDRPREGRGLVAGSAGGRRPHTLGFSLAAGHPRSAARYCNRPQATSSLVLQNVSKGDFDKHAYGRGELDLQLALTSRSLQAQGRECQGPLWPCAWRGGGAVGAERVGGPPGRVRIEDLREELSRLNVRSSNPTTHNVTRASFNALCVAQLRPRRSVTIEAREHKFTRTVEHVCVGGGDLGPGRGQGMAWGTPHANVAQGPWKALRRLCYAEPLGRSGEQLLGTGKHSEVQDRQRETMSLLSTLQALGRAGPAALPRPGPVEKVGGARWAALLAAVPAVALLWLALGPLEPEAWRSGAEPPELQGRGQSRSEWWMEDAVGFGRVRMGVPGVASLVLFVNPLIETMPKIKREASVGSLPLLPFSAMVMSGSIWASYGWLRGSPAIWVPNCCQLLFGLYCHVFCRFCPAGAASLPCSRRVHAAGAACSWAVCAACLLLLPESSGSILLGLLGNAMNVMLFAGPLAVIRSSSRARAAGCSPRKSGHGRTQQGTA